MASQLFGDGELVYHSVAVMIHRDHGCREFPFCIANTTASRIETIERTGKSLPRGGTC